MCLKTLPLISGQLFEDGNHYFNAIYFKIMGHPQSLTGADNSRDTTVTTEVAFVLF